MALRDTAEAIGAVTDLLRSRLTLATGAVVDVGKPEASAGTEGEKFNIFLYQIDFDPYLRNEPLDAGQPDPLWLVLRYLLTAVDEKDTDSAKAHRLLGRGLVALQAMNFLRPDALAAPLADNPEPLKLTFDSADAELLSKIMQGTDEKYRLSAAFQVRPVMLVPDVPPAYAPAVRTIGPPGREGVAVVPSLGPRLSDLRPGRFRLGQTLLLSGDDLFANVHRLSLGGLELPLSPAGSGQVTAVIPMDAVLSPGPYAVSVFQVLPSGRRLASDGLLGQVLPRLDSAIPGPLAAQAGGNLSGTLALAGACLGGPDDAIFVAFCRDGKTAFLAEPTGLPGQAGLAATVEPARAIPPGAYRIVLRVNGVQAPEAPEVVWA